MHLLSHFAIRELRFVFPIEPFYPIICILLLQLNLLFCALIFQILILIVNFWHNLGAILLKMIQGI